MALALAEYKGNVNAIFLGIVDTQSLIEVGKKFASLLGWEIGEPKRRFVESSPLGRIEEPEDVASVAVFLASPVSDSTMYDATNHQR